MKVTIELTQFLGISKDRGVETPVPKFHTEFISKIEGIEKAFIDENLFSVFGGYLLRPYSFSACRNWIERHMEETGEERSLGSFLAQLENNDDLFLYAFPEKPVEPNERQSQSDMYHRYVYIGGAWRESGQLLLEVSEMLLRMVVSAHGAGAKDWGEYRHASGILQSFKTGNWL